MEASKKIELGARPNILRVEVDLAALASLENRTALLKAKHKYDGVEICLHDAICYDDPSQSKFLSYFNHIFIYSGTIRQIDFCRSNWNCGQLHQWYLRSTKLPS